MKCPTCVAEGKQSRVYVGGGASTSMYCPPFYDEDGKWHDHDMNLVSQSYSCSNGHKWTEAVEQKCWCGWTR